MLRLYLLLFPVYLTAGLNGFDGSLMSGVNAIPAYQKYYGMNGAGSSTGILFAIYNIGAVVSVPFLAPLADGWGRRWGIFVGCVFVIVGTCIQAPSTSVGMLWVDVFSSDLVEGLAICQVLIISQKWRIQPGEAQSLVSLGLLRL